MVDDVGESGQAEPDIQKGHLPSLSWQDGDVATSLETVYDHVAGNATSYIDW